MPNTNATSLDRTLVIGAGVGGLACAIRLAAAGHKVSVLERHDHVGGKIRTLPSAAGPVDAGPTVLTMRHVFDDLFAVAGTRLEDHVTLHKQNTLARHFWQDGSTLDLHADPAQNIDAIDAFAGPKAADQFRRFSKRTTKLFDAFDAPMMRAAQPKLSALTKHVIKRPHLITAMAPTATLDKLLKRQFDDPRLQQLFGRYATYVGGSPYQSPAVLALIWQAEAAGVWVVEGGMHKLAQAMGKLARNMGVEIMLGTGVEKINAKDGKVTGVTTQQGREIAASQIVFNGDPRALATGLLGKDTSQIAPQTRKADRSLSARVYSFAAQYNGPDLAHHNVFFANDAQADFDALKQGQMPPDTTLYLCAEDRGTTHPAPNIERFEIIANAPPTDTTQIDEQELTQWHQTTLQTMAKHAVTFTKTPQITDITTPPMFNKMFPASQGALYGQSTHGLMAAFQRPTARTPVSGLYLAGGGCHPGAGVPMATLSGQHAAEAILSDQTSTSTSVQTAMRGGMSTA